jgi:hypothetical protein
MTMTDNSQIGFALIALINFAILLGWPVFTLFSLLSLRGRHLSNPTQAIWVLIVVAVPFLGPLAYWIMRPQREPADQLR